MKQQSRDRSTNATANIQFPTVPCKRSETKKMKALEYIGKKKVRLTEVPRVILTDPKDAIVRITATTICGSDLHLYHGLFPEVYKHDILGHEAIGIVEEVNTGVTKFKKGDRVALSCIFACGECQYCQREEYSLCDNTNSSKKEESFYGHRTSGIPGYSHLMGGYEGFQAEYARVPIADMNLIPLSDNISVENAILLSDVANTAWHGNDIASVGDGDIVGIWGAGPVGLVAAFFSAYRGASRVIVIDNDNFRLNLAKKNVEGVETINFKEEDVTKTLQKLVPGGLTVGIECVGFRFPKDVSHKIQQLLKLETDDSGIIDEIFTNVCKHARVALLGDYLSYCNSFPIGMLHAKSLQLFAGQNFAQKYQHHLAKLMETGEIDLSWIFTHRLPFSDTAKAYAMFDKHQDNMVKVRLDVSLETPQQKTVI
uniref:Uncharacterized protein n=1 Tax=Percolomonas cosmopolitus TaxID=63605 RepID=A0A7S1KPV6_9EUKA|mmetsp:Transcript_4438/g.16745  ORF Transcript_4438/g.16745 Transcript_4438/m.16745 type:complete len:426 (+) Transcript_4438:376-1653(+)|eukprot:CAMPEP_0117443952 /NCGR_PEP_ID=MMETSP0759-20121206/4977_1 /TAXON_ID=63605 /ORGANISM="Percolomonas cosmopolitus, Strain WS" /LENGTH=425 /DNA_ID=CAMNT_0005235977 /DNA_START=368 /DNA_END=1645 /DNA_ORIENTATION=+